MRQFSWRPCRAAISAVGLAASLGGCGDKIEPNIVTPDFDPGFEVTPLIANRLAPGIATVDTLLVSPRGLTFAETGNLWVVNAGSGLVTVYTMLGQKQGLVVSIPTATAAMGGTPTAIIGNTTADFTLPNGRPAQFLFGTEGGVIAGWNPQSTSAAVVVDRSAEHAVYTGLATATNDGANFLLAADFHNRRIDLFDDDFRFLRSFSDPQMLPGFAPFGIATISGRIFVTFAKQAPPDNRVPLPGPGDGFIVAFNPNGTVAMRFAGRGVLNAPWGMALSPGNFGKLRDQLLVGNTGDGRIVAYNFNTGVFTAFLYDFDKSPIQIDGLWGLSFSPEPGSAALYFASAPGGAARGLIGTVTPR